MVGEKRERYTALFVDKVVAHKTVFPWPSQLREFNGVGTGLHYTAFCAVVLNLDISNMENVFFCFALNKTSR